jgi:hypothetical protein
MHNRVATESPVCHSQPELFGNLASRTRADIAEAQRRRDEGVALADEATDDFWRNTVDQAIRHFAARGEPFSQNELRELLPEPNSPFAFGARFLKAARDGVIQPIGAVRSTKRESNCAWITQWGPGPNARQAA